MKKVYRVTSREKDHVDFDYLSTDLDFLEGGVARFADTVTPDKVTWISPYMYAVIGVAEVES